MIILLRVSACFALLGFFAHLGSVTTFVGAYILWGIAVLSAGLAQIVAELRARRDTPPK